MSKDLEALRQKMIKLKQTKNQVDTATSDMEIIDVTRRAAQAIEQMQKRVFVMSTISILINHHISHVSI